MMKKKEGCRCFPVSSLQTMNGKTEDTSGVIQSVEFSTIHYFRIGMKYMKNSIEIYVFR